MDTDRAELSALATSIDEVTRRVTAAADRLRGTPRDDIANGLYEVERSLLTAGRKLDRVIRDLR
jgi:hypothetical protein